MEFLKTPALKLPITRAACLVGGATQMPRSLGVPEKERVSKLISKNNAEPQRLQCSCTCSVSNTALSGVEQDDTELAE